MGGLDPADVYPVYRSPYWNGPDLARRLDAEEKGWLTELHATYYRAKAESFMKYKFQVGASPYVSPSPSPEKLVSPEVVYIVRDGSEEPAYRLDIHEHPEREVTPFRLDEEEPLRKPGPVLDAQVQRRLKLIGQHPTLDPDEVAYF
jgi:hypothetical protein